MSWIEDNGFDGYSGPSRVNDPLAFRSAIWITKNGEKYRLKEMTDSHLLNAYRLTTSIDIQQTFMKEMTYRLFEKRVLRERLRD